MRWLSLMRMLTLMQLLVGMWLSRKAVERIERHVDREVVR